MANCTQSKKVFEEWVNRVDTRIKPSMMIADITKTGGLVLLKKRTGWIFILDSMEKIWLKTGFKMENLYGLSSFFRKIIPHHLLTVSLKRLKIKLVC